MMLKVNREDRKVVQESLRHANSRVALDAYAQAVTPAKRAAQRKVVSLTTGYCFNAREWTFADFPLRGVYATNCVYEAVTGWDAFEPALTKAEEMGADVIWNCAAEIPEEWYEGDGDGLHRLAESLSSRRHLIRRLITIFRESVRKRFPNWRDSWPKVGGRTAHSNVLHPE